MNEMSKGMKRANTRPPAVKHQSIGDTDIPYLDYGGDGRPVVLLHATGFLPWLWHPIAGSLSNQFRIIAPYFCDHRDADPHEGGMGWLTLAEDLKRLCGELKLEKPFFVGHSMGATVITLAHVLQGVPAEKMILIEPILLPREFYRIPVAVDQHPLASKAGKRRNYWPNRTEVLNDFKAKKFFQSWDEEVFSLYITHGVTDRDDGGLELTCSPRREAALFMGSMQYDPWPILPKVTCPTLIVEGEISENRHFIDLGRATELIPAGEYILIKNAGHLIPMEKPAETGRIIQSFFG